MLEAKKKVALVLFRERDQRALNNNRARSFYIHLFFKKSPETKNPRNKGRETLARECVCERLKNGYLVTFDYFLSRNAFLRVFQQSNFGFGKRIAHRKIEIIYNTNNKTNGGHPTDGGAGTPGVNPRDALGGCFVALREHRDRVLGDRVSRVRDEEWAKSCFVEQDF